MRFTIKRDEFLKGLSIASRSVNPKMVADPVLVNLKIELNERGLFITGSNREVTIRSFTPYQRGEAEIIRNFKEGTVLINSKVITEAVRKMEGDEITLDVVDTTIAVIYDNKSEFTINCVRAEEYPDLDLDPSGIQLSLSRPVFSAIVSQTAFAASIKEQRPVLTALNFQASNGLLTVIATDGARMAKKTIPVSEEISFVANIPAKTMVDIDHLLENASMVDIDISEKKALLSFNGNIISTRMIGGQFPDTKNAIPKDVKYRLEINASELIKSIERAGILLMDRDNVVELSMSCDSVEVSAKSSQVGSSVEKIEIFKFEGDNLHIAFNSEQVSAAIRALSCEDVLLEFDEFMKPFAIKNPKDDSIIQVVVPLQAN